MRLRISEMAWAIFISFSYFQHFAEEENNNALSAAICMPQIFAMMFALLSFISRK